MAAALGVAPERLLSLHQVHSAEVVVAGPEGWAERPRADAAVTAAPGVALGVLTADCAPVLFADREAGVVGAAHAGWRGALDGVLEATVAAMERLGAARRAHPRGGRADDQPARLRGRAGVLRPLPRRGRRATSGSSPRGRATGCASTCRASCWRGCARPGSARPGWIGACTYSEPDRFFSYRRATQAGEADYGRLISAIRL